ncbi:MAG TPA: lipopolysaccharide biosynthesis protein [Terriglobales bacterium]|nr:lipopolysaccharide biosynthesis protein [Terriglobales bacterium]
MKPFDSNGDFLRLAEGHRLRRAAVRSAGITLLGQGASFFVQIASTMVLARLLTPNDFGIVTMVTTFSLLFSSFSRNGFMELVMQRDELTHSLASNLFWIQLTIGAALTLTFAGLGPLLALLYHNSTVAQVAEGMSLTIGIGCLGWIHWGLLQRAMRFRATAIINFVGQLCLVIFSIALAMAGWHYWALVWGSVAQTLVMAAGAWLMCRWTPSWPRRVSGTGSGLKFAINVYVHFAFSYSTRNTDNLLVGWRYGARALGFYKKAYDLFVLPETQLLAPISAVAVTTLSRVKHDREQFQRYFLRLVSILALLGMGIGADFALVGKDLIRFLLGPGWEEAGRIFALFGPGIGVMLLYNTHGWVHLSIGRPERWLRWGLIEFACTGSLFLLALRWGPSGIAVAWTTSYFLLMFPGFWYAGKPIGLGIGPILASIWKFFAASVMAGLATALIVKAMPNFAAAGSGADALIRMIWASSVFFGLYLVGVILLHQGLQPLRETARLCKDLLPERMNGRSFRAAADI